MNSISTLDPIDTVIIDNITRTLSAVMIDGKKTGFIEQRFDNTGVLFASFAHGTVKKAALTRLRKPGVDLPFMLPPNSTHRTQKGAVRRQGKREHKVELETLAVGDQVVGCVDRTFAEKGYSFFTVIGRVIDGQLVQFDLNRQPSLFVHDSKVPQELINDLDPDSDRVYAIEVHSGRQPGQLEGSVFGLEDKIELQKAA